jgi:hypothetical protein
VAGLPGGEGLNDIFGAGVSLAKMFCDAKALLWGKRGDCGENAAQSYGYVVNVVHQANGFSGEGHG